MALGKAPKQGSMFQSAAALCDETLPEESIYKLLHRVLGIGLGARHRKAESANSSAPAVG
jgi:hypothetical protein